MFFFHPFSVLLLISVYAIKSFEINDHLFPISYSSSIRCSKPEPINESFELILEYFDQQEGWFYSLTYGDIEINNARLTYSPNILWTYKHLFPFGIAFISHL